MTNYTKSDCWLNPKTQGQGAGKGKYAEPKGKGKGDTKGKGKGDSKSSTLKPACTYHLTKGGCNRSTACLNHHASVCRKWDLDHKSCPDQAKCRYLHRKIFDPFKEKALPAKLQSGAEPKPKAKAKAKGSAKKACVAKVQEDQVAFQDVMNDCDYPRDDS